MCCLVIFVFSLVICYLLEKVIRSLKVDGFGEKFVFITGCDSGFGQLLALRLDRLGFPVFAACLTAEGQKYLSENASPRLVTLSLDVTNTESIKKAHDFVKEKLPQGSGLWAIVNNAGITGPIGPTEMCSLEGFYKASAVNLFGPIEICRKFLPLVRKLKGRVVNISSMMGRNALANAPYNVSKFGMEGFSDSLRREVYNQGIKVSILEPGFFQTNISNPDVLIKSVTDSYNQADVEIQTVYGKNYVEDFTAFVENCREYSSKDLNPVLDAYTHAIVSRFPKTRYVVGWDAILFVVPLSYIPAGILDWMLSIQKTRIAKTVKMKQT